MKFPKRSTVMVAAIAAMFVAPALWSVPGGPFSGRGTSCSDATNCEAGATVKLVENRFARETAYALLASDVSGYPLLASLFDALGNASNHPTATAVNPGEITYGLREGQALEWMQFLSDHKTSLLRYQGRTIGVSLVVE